MEGAEGENRGVFYAERLQIWSEEGKGGLTRILRPENPWICNRATSSGSMKGPTRAGESQMFLAKQAEVTPAHKNADT